jgi:cytochrome P450
VPIIGWEILDTLFRPEVLKQVQTEIKDCSDHVKKGVNALDMPKLLLSPLLQSIYCEELRLRNGVIIQRVPVVDNFKIGPWKFPKGQMIIASSWHEQRDRSIWNEGPVNERFHSVDDFWAERFLVYPNDPSTGPRKPSPDMKVKIQKSDEKTVDEKPKFTAIPVTGSFIPYGGGEKICPGRFYAKVRLLCGYGHQISDSCYSKKPLAP